jgi:hypothetical protein
VFQRWLPRGYLNRQGAPKPSIRSLVDSLPIKATTCQVVTFIPREVGQDNWALGLTLQVRKGTKSLTPTGAIGQGFKSAQFVLLLSGKTLFPNWEHGKIQVRILGRTPIRHTVEKEGPLKSVLEGRSLWLATTSNPLTARSWTSFPI